LGSPVFCEPYFLGGTVRDLQARRDLYANEFTAPSSQG